HFFETDRAMGLQRRAEEHRATGTLCVGPSPSFYRRAHMGFARRHGQALVEYVAPALEPPGERLASHYDLADAVRASVGSARQRNRRERSAYKKYRLGRTQSLWCAAVRS